MSCIESRKEMTSSESEINTRVLENFREYLKIPTFHPNVNYDKLIKTKYYKTTNIFNNIFYIIFCFTEECVVFIKKKTSKIS